MTVSFYVYNNLRSVQDHVKTELFRYDNLQDAINKYKELPAEWTSAIGASIDLRAEVDLVQRRNKESVLVTDYRRMASFKDREDINLYVNDIINQLNIQYELVSGVHPYVSILGKLVEVDANNRYINDKMLYVRKNDVSGLNQAINEVYVVGKGWLNPEQFANLNKNQYGNSYNPKVTFINVNYITQNGNIGQADVTPNDFMKLKEKTKMFLQEKKNTEASLHETIIGAKQKATDINKNLDFDNERKEIEKNN